ncbi:flavin reductase like domain-containing protein, partial [Chaetomidium leptoderma]
PSPSDPSFTSLLPPRQPFHTTSPTATTPTPHRQRPIQRHPRAFHLTGPEPPSIHPHSSSATTPTDPSLPEQFRTVMRLLTNSVVVCTSTQPAHPGHPGTAAIPRAMTMSSFTSLALTPPSPVVSLNIAVPSRTYDAVAASRRFNIHVLADDESGARVADWFTGGNAEGREVFERLVEEGGVAVVRSGSAAAVESGEAPVLEGDGVLYVLRCKLLDDEPARGLVRVRDHVIVLGEVVEIVEGSGAQREAEERFGLLYADRRYRQLGGCITPGGDGIDGK